MEQPRRYSEPSPRPQGNKMRLIEIAVLSITLVITYAVCSIVYYTVPVNRKEFSCSDQSIMMAYKESETVSGTWCFVYSVATLLLSIIVTDTSNYLISRNVRAFPLSHDERKHLMCRQILNTTRSVMLGVLAMGLAILLMVIGKKSVGAYRPDFLEACFGSRAAYQEFCIKEAEKVFAGRNAVPMAIQISPLQTCSHNGDKLDYESTSFPSGHTTLAVSTTTFSLLYVNFQMRPSSRPFSTIWQITLVGVTWFISISRIMDNKHFYRDVFGGTLIGILASSLVYLTLHLNPYFKKGEDEFAQKNKV